MKHSDNIGAYIGDVLLGKQAQVLDRAAAAAADAAMVERPEDQQVLSTMTLHCKTCKTLTVEVLATVR